MQQPYTFHFEKMTAVDFSLIAAASRQGNLWAILAIANKYTDTDTNTLLLSDLNTFMDCFGSALAEWHDKQQLQQALAGLRKDRGNGHHD